jgi:hypothetical protein
MKKSDYWIKIVNLKLENNSIFLNNKILIGLNSLNLFFLFYKTYQKRKLLNIYILDLISSYKGWKHLFLLPVNNQRTWTNAKTVFLNNRILRDHKIFLFKNYYGNIHMFTINDLLNIEIFNYYWKSQWYNEWVELKKKRLKILKKNPWLLKKISNVKNLKNINLKVEKDEKTINSNLFLLGYEPGFTKIFL